MGLSFPLLCLKRDNAVHLLELANKPQHKDLFDYVFSYIIHHFTEVCKTPAFQELVTKDQELAKTIFSAL